MQRQSKTKTHQITRGIHRASCCNSDLESFYFLRLFRLLLPLPVRLIIHRRRLVFLRLLLLRTRALVARYRRVLPLFRLLPPILCVRVWVRVWVWLRCGMFRLFALFLLLRVRFVDGTGRLVDSIWRLIRCLRGDDGGDGNGGFLRRSRPPSLPLLPLLFSPLLLLLRLVFGGRF